MSDAELLAKLEREQVLAWRTVTPAPEPRRGSGKIVVNPVTPTSDADTKRRRWQDISRRRHRR